MGLSKKKNLSILKQKLTDIVKEEEVDQVQPDKSSTKETIEKDIKKIIKPKSKPGRKKEATLIDGGCLLTSN